MTRLEEIKEKSKLRREQEKQEFINKLDKIEYRYGLGQTKASANISKIIDDKIYYFGFKIMHNGTKVYEINIKNDYLESAYYNKQYIDKCPQKWESEFEILENYIDEQIK